MGQQKPCTVPLTAARTRLPASREGRRWKRRMKRTITKILLIPSLCLLGCEDDSGETPPETNAPSATAEPSGSNPVDSPQPDVEFEPGMVLVGFRTEGTDGITIAEADVFFGAYGLAYEVLGPSSSDPNRIWVALVSVPVGTEWQWVLTFRDQEIVDYAELNVIASAG